MQPPTGLVTLLFTDIEGSTASWEAQPEAMAVAVNRHEKLLRAAIVGSSGYVFSTGGDSFCASFSDARDAVVAATEAQAAVKAEHWPEPLVIRVRMAMHSGSCEERDGDYFGPTVNRAARLEAAAHGGQTLISGDTADLLGPRIPEGISLSDLGAHRLKDLGTPVHVFQVDAEGLERQFPPLRSLDNPSLGNNLPQQIASFVGREHEMEQVRSLLGTCRLVTLCGSGGVGKSRLAVQVAADLLDGSGNGVWLVELAPLTEPGLVTREIASVLSVRDEPGTSIADSLCNALRERSLLLVLDNCEHLIEASAEIVEVLLRSCPRVEILATSREPLGVEGEHVYRVPSLSLPTSAVPQGLAGQGSEAGDTAATVRESEAAQLFSERATERDSTFTLDDSNAAAVASICRQLDGIPLAMELAASRIGSLSIEDIESRLGNRFRLLTTGRRSAGGRQQTLRALVDWSYDLLVEPERVLLSRLSVFAGGFSLDRAELVCANGAIADHEVLDRLSSLVDKSLVQADPAGTALRYRLLETIREYSAERLSERPAPEEEHVRSRHASAYLAFAEKAAEQLGSPDQVAWLRQLDHEHDNMRRALDELAREGRSEEVLRLAIALDHFWRIRGQFGEGIAALESGLASYAAGDAGHTAGARDAGLESTIPEKALVTLGALRTRSGDVHGAVTALEQAVVQARRLGDARITADALGELGYANQRLGNYATAFEHLNEAVVLAREIGDNHLLSVSLDTFAGVCLDTEVEGERPAMARYSWDEALRYSRSAGNIRLTAVILNNLAGLAMLESDMPAAREYLEESLPLSAALGSDTLTSTALTNLGCVAVLEGDFVAARQSYREALDMSWRSGSMINTAYSFNGLSLCLSASGDLLGSIKLHAAADALFARSGEALDAQESDLRERDMAKLKEAVGSDEAKRVYESGFSLSAQEANTLARELLSAT